MRIQPLLIICIIPFFLSCEILNSGENIVYDDIEILLSDDQIVAGESFEITIHNQGKATVMWKGQCDPNHAVRLMYEEESWKKQKAATCMAVLPDIKIEAGESKSFQQQITEPGKYKYQFGLYIGDGKHFIPGDAAKTGTITVLEE